MEANLDYLKLRFFPLGWSWHVDGNLLKKESSTTTDPARMFGLSIAAGLTFKDQGELNLTYLEGSSSDELYIHELPVDVPALNQNDGMARYSSTSAFFLDWCRYFTPRQELAQERLTLFDSYTIIGAGMTHVTGRVTSLKTGFGQSQRAEVTGIDDWVFTGRAGLGLDVFRIQVGSANLAMGGQATMQVGEQMGLDFLAGLSISDAGDRK